MAIATVSNAPTVVQCHDQRFAGRPIRFRVPYTKPGEMVVAAQAVNIAFPAGTYLHGVELPFEIWDVKLEASQSVAQTPFVPVAEPAPRLSKFWRVRLRDTAKNQTITAAAQLVDSVIERPNNIWRFPFPYTVVRSEGFEVEVDNLLPANWLRAEVTFRGYLLILEPPSETR